MRHRPLTFLAALFLAAGTTSTASAQSNSSGEAAAPAGQTSATNGSASAPAEPASKKVWTNEDVPGLRGESKISTFSEPDAKPGETHAPISKNANAKAFQAQIARLQAQIPPLDSQIAELQAAIDGKPTGDGKTSQRPRGVKADDWSVEMQDLQKKRDGILEQINALRDEARHKGVPPNSLP